MFNTDADSVLPAVLAAISECLTGMACVEDVDNRSDHICIGFNDHSVMIVAPVTTPGKDVPAGADAVSGDGSSDDERAHAFEMRWAARHGAPTLEHFRRAYQVFSAEWPGDDVVRARHIVAEPQDDDAAGANSGDDSVIMRWRVDRAWFPAAEERGLGATEADRARIEHAITTIQWHHCVPSRGGLTSLAGPIPILELPSFLLSSIMTRIGL